MAWARSAADWLFRERRTGRIVIWQFPNVPLLAWLAATVVRMLTHGAFATTFGYIGTAALTYWAGDEIARGVNPFRRLVGVVVLTGIVVHLARSA